MSLSWRRKRLLTGRLGTSRCSVLACLLFVTASARPVRAASPEAPVVRAVESVGMTVADVERSIRFYSKVLSFEKIFDIELQGSDYEHLEGVYGLRMHVVAMRLGDESIELTEYLTPQGRPVPSDSHSNDRWFQHISIITSDMNRAYAWLRENRVQHVSTGPQTLPDYIKSAAGIRAFYFDDPDGHPLEILEFPPDKGDPKWRHANGKLFLGIDHTAIAVANTSASLQFYRDLLGFRVAGESENYGSEQEHLNSVFGARLRITSLRSLEGPGIELLEYLAPAGGRAMPGDEHANDVIHHQTRLVTDDIGAALTALQERRYQLISSGIATFAKAELGFHSAMIVRDPDGHAIELVKK